MTAKRKPKPNPADRAFRDHVAVEVCRICVGDLSRQISGGTMPIQDSDRAVDFITRFSYAVADAMILARDRKPASDANYRCRLLDAQDRMNDLDRYAVTTAIGTGLDEIGRHVGIPR